MKRLICAVLAAWTICLGVPQQSYAQGTGPGTTDPNVGFDQLIAVLQVIIDLIAALNALGSLGNPTMMPMPNPTPNPTPQPTPQVAPTPEIIELPTPTEECQIIRVEKVELNAPFFLDGDSFNSIFIDFPIPPRTTVTAKELSAGEIANSNGALRQCLDAGIRIPMITPPRAPLLIDNCTVRNSGLCEPNLPNTIYPGFVSVTASDSAKRAETPNSCRPDFDQVPETGGGIMCRAEAIIMYRFNEGPTIPSPAGPIESFETATTRIIDIVFIPSFEQLVFFANLICEGSEACFFGALDDFA